MFIYSFQLCEEIYINSSWVGSPWVQWTGWWIVKIGTSFIKLMVILWLCCGSTNIYIFIPNNNEHFSTFKILKSTFREVLSLFYKTIKWEILFIGPILCHELILFSVGPIRLCYFNYENESNCVAVKNFWKKSNFWRPLSYEVEIRINTHIIK